MLKIFSRKVVENSKEDGLQYNFIVENAEFVRSALRCASILGAVRRCLFRWAFKGNKIMLRYIVLGAAVVLTGVLSGCGLSPQYLKPEPRFSGQVSAVGQGQPVTVRVSDGRASAVIGTRGGLYANTSTISVQGASFLPRLQAETDAAVRMLGFTPMAKGSDNAQLDLTLTELSYKAVENNPLSKEAKLQAVFTLAVKNGSRSYNGRYAATLTQGYVKAPNEQTNTEWVSLVLSEALQRVFKDPAIGQLLAQ